MLLLKAKLVCEQYTEVFSWDWPELKEEYAANITPKGRADALKDLGWYTLRCSCGFTSAYWSECDHFLDTPWGCKILQELDLSYRAHPEFLIDYILRQPGSLWHQIYYQ